MGVVVITCGLLGRKWKTVVLKTRSKSGKLSCSCGFSVGFLQTACVIVLSLAGLCVLPI
jgi:hypothetical protein